ncbi:MULTISPECIES: MTH865 family protein [Salinibaculum]|uniref:MTH865 family protein n=1 Tax=Salinibaculum TaxID=2732368 RepID=UPI0030CFC908
MTTTESEPGDDPERTEAERELRTQFEAVFGEAAFPLTDPFDLIPLLPDGPETTFEADGVTIEAIELGLTYGKYQRYPYDSVERLVDDIIDGLRAEGEL